MAGRARATRAAAWPRRGSRRCHSKCRKKSRLRSRCADPRRAVGYVRAFRRQPSGSRSGFLRNFGTRRKASDPRLPRKGGSSRSMRSLQQRRRGAQAVGRCGKPRPERHSPTMASKRARRPPSLATLQRQNSEQKTTRGSLPRLRPANEVARRGFFHKIVSTACRDLSR